jgi:WD40 repeat protein
VIVTRPADNPFEQLKTSGVIVESQDLTESVRLWLAQQPQQTRLVLIIDQFEELLIACPKTVYLEFVEQLVQLLGSPLPITVIITMRDDFYGQIVQQESLEEWIARGLVNISQKLKQVEVTAIVQKPAEAVSLRFQEGLVEAIVNDTLEVASLGEEGRVARSTILPLLEFALTELWKKREDGILSSRAYNAMGKVTGGLTQWADQVFYGLKTKEEQWEEKQREVQQKLAQRIFTDLIYIGDESQGIPDSRRRVSLASLCRKANEITDVHQVVQQLVAGHLLVTTRDMQRNDEMVEIIHDALLWEWGQLQQWLRDDRDFLVWHQEFEKRVRTWVETDNDNPDRREEDKLFVGTELDKAIQWLINRPGDLSQAEQDFIQASQKRRAREESFRKRYEVVRRRMLVTSILGGAALSIGGGWLTIAWLGSLITPYIDTSTYSGHKKPVWRIAWSRDASRIASASQDRTVQVWSANTGRYIYTYAGHKDSVTAVTWSLDGYYVASASYDTTVQVWNPDGFNLHKPYTYRQHTDLVLAVAWSPDGKYIASAGHDRVVGVWQPFSNETLYTYRGHTDSVNTVTWSPDSKRIASGSGDSTVQVWDVMSGKNVMVYRGHSNHLVSAAWSPNGKYIASAGWDTDHRIQVWDAVTGKTLYTYASHHQDVVTAVSWSPDSAYIASASWDGTVQVWNAFNGNVICAYPEHHAKLLSTVWSPKDKHIASAGYDQIVRVWQLK